MDLIKSISIENLVAKRNGTVNRLRALFNTVDGTDQEIGQLSGQSLRHLLGGWRDCRLFDGEAGLTAAIAEVDAGFWGRLLLESGIRTFMASGDRAKWDKNIIECKVPELTEENVRSTFASLYAARGEMFTDGVVAVFRGLSWDHKTNSPMAFTKKIIMANLWMSKGDYISDHGCNVLDDLVRAMHVLDGKPEPDVRRGMRKLIHEVDRPQRYWDADAKAHVQPASSDTLENDYFTLKWFKKTGTAHCTFKRQDLVDRMNMVLGSRFPDAIATDVRNPSNRPKPAPVPGLRSISSAAITALRAMRAEGNRLVGLPQLDRAVYEEVNRVLSSLGGEWVSSAKAHVFAGVPEDSVKYVLSKVLREQAYAAPEDFGFFPSPTAVVEMLIKLSGVKHGMRVLEPSAGRGAIVKALMDAGCKVRAIELIDSNIRHLQGLGCSVSQGDFLETHVSRETDETLFDAIVMNPPFAKHQDIAHVMHATHFLKPGGRLVAVMAGGVKFGSDKYSTQFRQYVSEFGELIDLPAGSFKESGTMVNTVIAVINKPDPALQIKATPQATQLMLPDHQLELA